MADECSNGIYRQVFAMDFVNVNWILPKLKCSLLWPFKVGNTTFVGQHLFFFFFFLGWCCHRFVLATSLSECYSMLIFHFGHIELIPETLQNMIFKTRIHDIYGNATTNIIV